MKVVILCGGRGTRLAEETKIIPNHLLKLKVSILEHIINYYNKFEIYNFIIATGYKGKLIEKYFKSKSKINKNKIKIVNTGLNTLTGGRLLKLKKYLKNDRNFMLTYGDGLSNVNIKKS